MNNKRTELLAPAGNMESLKAAVAGGADAIYLGLTSFSARAFAGNFSHEEFQEAIRYCHTRNVRIYVTINTMLYEKEIENAKKEVAFLYENDCDGILIQDYGLWQYVRTCYPDMEAHTSTQMHIHNLAGVKKMQAEGAARVVLARETPLEVIREACATGVDIEVFAYGAICISYSGQCLMSAAVKNRSANRGMCAQCCRLKYYPEDGSAFKEGDYILSPKDLNTIERLPELLECGVASLKIEGRMKRPEYVWLVTRTFREAIDAYYRGEEYHVTPEREKHLLEMFNRGFSSGHIFHAEVEDRMSQHRPNHRGIEVGRVLQFRNGRVQVKLSEELNQHDGLRILNEPVDTGLTAVKIYDERDRLVNHANSGEVVWLDCHSKPAPKKGQPLQKTSDSKLIGDIDDRMRDEIRMIDITAEYEAVEGKPFTVTLRDDRGNVASASSEQICEAAKNAPVKPEKIETSIRKSGEYPYLVTEITGEAGNIFLPVSLMNETRRQAMEALDQMRANLNHHKGMVPYNVTLADPCAHPAEIIVHSETAFDPEMEGVRVVQEGYEAGNLLPVVNENLRDDIKHRNNILSSQGDFYGKHEHSIAGMNMNIANSYAISYALQQGAEAVIFSSECSDDQIEDALHAFEVRYGFRPFTYKFVYGRRTAMYIKDGFVRDRNLDSFEDLHGNVYKIHYNNGITEISEPEIERRENRFCAGSYLIFNEEDLKKRKNILEEAYEELHERI